MKKVVLLFAVAAVTLVGCNNDEKKETISEENTENVESAIVDIHSSENSLDWAGVYEGTTPCADCKGIKTVLELNEDQTFILSQTYLGGSTGENELKQTGEFIWNHAGAMIRLRTETGGFQYKVGENQLWMLDVKGNTIEGDLADMYILKKTIQ
ncbi:copper resistance protein NlpE [Aequorivita lipolytica]|uniref:Copper resistance protein NlpE n=1 Tax=Aequorivita lipolytica TaxID=153267 RepID=A0A5C6YPG8_9FLAO|nr:copper resistance protein NlpE [Aequorivita lipolytica]TXD69268.1 copper resistance protein NlpE [Aequorivita lipolytica]SRX50111.1 Lipoprotein NlpE [Aequorivita lipolytica]